MSVKSVFFACMVALVLATPSFAAATTISSCMTLGYNGTGEGTNSLYVLNQSVSSPGNCFIISSSNVTLDCAGNSIYYAQTSQGSAISLSFANFANITIRNCNIALNSTQTDSPGVNMSPLSQLTSLTIANNTINTSTTGSNAITLYNVSNSSIANNAVYANAAGSTGVLLDSANGDSFTNNSISVCPSACNSLYLNSSSGAELLNTSFNQSLIGWGVGSNNLSIGWMVRENVSFSNGSAASGALVNITNASGSTPMYENQATDSSGLTGWQAVTQSIGNNTVITNYTPYEFDVVAGQFFSSQNTSIEGSQTIPLTANDELVDAFKRRYDGANAGGQLGVSVAVGDLNGDGIPDLIIGAPDASNNGRSSSGSVYVIYGNSSDLDGAFNMSDPESYNLRFDGADSGDGLGNTVAVADLYGDGRNELIIGAPYTSNNGLSESGSVYVINSTSNLPDGDYDLSYHGNYSKRFDGSQAGDQIGISSPEPGIQVGDLDGDAEPDLVISAPDASNTGSSSGSIYVISGGIDFADGAYWLNDSGNYSRRYDGSEPGDDLGEQIAVGDVNNDSIPDLVASAYTTFTGGGSVYVINGSSNITDGNYWLNYSGNYSRRYDGVSGNDLGDGGVAVGDVSDVGTNALIMGDDGASFAGTGTGSVYVVNWNSSIPDGTYDLSDSSTYSRRYDGASTGSNCFGDGLAVGGVLGNGKTDLVIGDCGASFRGSDTGSTYVILANDTPDGIYELSDPSNYFERIDGEQSGGRFGYTLAAGFTSETAGLQIGEYYLNSDSGSVYSMALSGQTPPVWSNNSTNSTDAGATALLSVQWKDNYALGNYTFEVDDGTGTSTNYSTTSFSGQSNWSNLSIQLNSQSGSEITWRVYATDLEGNMNSTPQYSFTVTGGSGNSQSGSSGGGSSPSTTSTTTSTTTSSITTQQTAIPPEPTPQPSSPPSTPQGNAPFGTTGHATVNLLVSGGSSTLEFTVAGPALGFKGIISEEFPFDYSDYLEGRIKFNPEPFNVTRGSVIAQWKTSLAPNENFTANITLVRLALNQSIITQIPQPELFPEASLTSGPNPGSSAQGTPVPPVQQANATANRIAALVVAAIIVALSFVGISRIKASK